jgi:hypothetical protein
LSTPRDPRQVTIERHVRAAALALLARERTVVEVVAALATAVGEMPVDLTPREVVAAGRRAYRARVVAEIERLEKQGRGRAAASIIARSYAADVRDPIEVETLTNKFRRWRRGQKRANARLAPQP